MRSRICSKVRFEGTSNCRTFWAKFWGFSPELIGQTVAFRKTQRPVSNRAVSASIRLFGPPVSPYEISVTSNKTVPSKVDRAARITVWPKSSPCLNHRPSDPIQKFARLPSKYVSRSSTYCFLVLATMGLPSPTMTLPKNNIAATGAMSV